MLITRYTVKGGLLRADKKHDDVHEELRAALADAGWASPERVEEWATALSEGDTDSVLADMRLLSSEPDDAATG